MKKWAFRETWLEFSEWVKYLRDYKEHLQKEQEEDTEVMRLKYTIDKQSKKITELQTINKLKDELLEKRDIRIDSLNSKITELMLKSKGNDLCMKIEKMKPSKNMTHTDVKEQILDYIKELKEGKE